MLSDYRYTPNPDLIEIIDDDNKPIILVPPVEAERQSLRHRGVAVLTYFDQHKLFLEKRKCHSGISSEMYDLPVTENILAGEAAEEAAIRALKQYYGRKITLLKHVGEINETAVGKSAYWHIFAATVDERTANLPLSPYRAKNGILVSLKDWRYLLEEYGELLGPLVLQLWQKNMLFHQETNNTEVVDAKRQDDPGY